MTSSLTDKTENLTPENYITDGLARSLIKSNFVWLVLTLIVLEVFLGVGRPLKFVHVKGTMLKDHDVVGCRVEQILFDSKGKNSIILGDSTADSICVYPDILNEKLPLNSYSRNFYLKAKTGETIISKAVNTSFTLKNLSFGGCLMSDQRLICQKLIDYGGTPKIAIVTVVPRPFIDSTVIEEISPVKCYFEHRFEGLEKVKNFKDLFEHYLSAVSNIYRTRSDYATVLCSLACSTFHRPLNTYESNKKTGIDKRNQVRISGTEEPIDAKESATVKSIGEEKKHYVNAYKYDPTVFQYQFSCFDRMIKSLKENNVVTIIVKLPLDVENLSLIDPNVLTMINQSVTKCTESHQVKLIDFQKDSDFDENDFVDSVHLNGPGSNKLWLKLARRIKEDPTLVAQIQNKLTENKK